MAQITVDTEFLKNTVEYIKESALVLNDVTAKTKEAADRIPNTVQVLKTAGLITEGREKVAEQKLSSHSETLDMLNKLAEYVNTLNAKQAAETPKTDKVAKEVDYKLGKATPGNGVKSAKVMKESDRVFLERLGIPVE